MRKLILLLFVISFIPVVRAESDETKLTVKLLIKDSEGGMTALENSAHEGCILSGAFLSSAVNQMRLIVDGGDKNIFFYQGVADSAKSEKPAPNKIVQFSFEAIPQDKSSDSITVLFKYVLYDLIKDNSRLDFNYNIRLFHKTLIIPFNKAVKPEFLKETFGKREVTLSVLKHDKSLAEKYSDFKTNYYSEINEALKTSVMNGTKISLGMEFIRSDQENKNILLHQLKYPIDSSGVLCDAQTEVVYKLPFSIYKCRFPVTYSTDNKGFVKINYNITVVPQSLEKNELKCDMFIECNNSSGILAPLFIKKHLTIYKGEKLKIDLLNSERKTRDYIAGYFTGDSHGLKNLFSSINEYFILSFEFTEQ
jgi:hypothetical protein